MADVGGAAAGWAGIAGGAAAHIQNFIGELSPAAMAQRREAKKAQERLRTGTGYGMSSAEKDTARSEGAQQAAATIGAQQAELMRAQNAGMAGGAVTDANRSIAREALAYRAQNEAQVQQASNAQAQQEYARDIAAVDAEAQRGRAAWQQQANISLQTTQGDQGAVTAQAEPSNAMRKAWERVGGAWNQQKAE